MPRKRILRGCSYRLFTALSLASIIAQIIFCTFSFEKTLGRALKPEKVAINRLKSLGNKA